jgi:NADH-quinone oxidoreductase subunit A
MDGHLGLLWPLGLYAALVVLLTLAMLGVSALLGERHVEPATGEPYESGIAPTGTAHARFASRFYLAAMFFVIFDLESIYLIAWAVAAKQLGWIGYWEVLVFVVVLLVALGYLWRIGALQFGSRPSRERRGGRRTAV